MKIMISKLRLGRFKGLSPAGCALLLFSVILVAVPAQAQNVVVAESDGSVTLNFEETDIRVLVNTISKATGTNFVIDPRVKGKITVLSSRPMSGDQLYSTFLSILQVHGYAAIPSGNVVKIVPEVNAKQDGGSLIDNFVAPNDDVITRIVQIDNVPAAQLVPILRPLVPQYGHLAAYPPANTLIISDRKANVDRLIKIIHKIDLSGDEEIELVQLQHATATDVVRILTSLQQTPGNSRNNTNNALQLVADERTNSILIGADKTERLRLKALIAHLDTPLDDDGSTQVIYLHYAKAETLAPILAGFATAGTAGGGAPAAAGAPANRGGVNIQPDADTNALVITAPPKILREIRSVIKQLDIRRAQVLVEAVVAEVSSERSAEIGVQWAALSAAGGGATNFGGSSGGSLAEVGALLLGGTGAISGTGLAGAIGTGATFAAGDFSGNSGVAALVRALAGDGNTNILSTPTIVTMDNEEAEISIGQEVPFLTGSFSSTGSTAGSVNPFQTIDRRDVGLTLNITPQINEGDTVNLKILQEVSNVQSGSAGGADLITSKRTISTTVTAEDRQMIVLGGLIDNNLRESTQKVPVLGDIPLVGNLFKYRTASRSKSNLMVFIKPTILRDGIASSAYTNAKYNFIRTRQLEQKREVPLLPNENRPLLLRLDQLEGRTIEATPNSPVIGSMTMAMTPGSARAAEAQQQPANNYRSGSTQSRPALQTDDGLGYTVEEYQQLYNQAPPPIAGSYPGTTPQNYSNNSYSTSQQTQPAPAYVAPTYVAPKTATIDLTPLAKPQTSPVQINVPADAMWVEDQAENVESVEEPSRFRINQRSGRAGGFGSRR